MPKRKKYRPAPNPYPSLTKKRKKELDQIFEKLTKYFMTEEGVRLGERVQEFQQSQRQRLRTIALTPKEVSALTFIRHRLSQGHSPSVREVARFLKVRSSRTAFILIKSLVSKGTLTCDLTHRLNVTYHTRDDIEF